MKNFNKLLLMENLEKRKKVHKMFTIFFTFALRTLSAFQVPDLFLLLIKWIQKAYRNTEPKQWNIDINDSTMFAFFNVQFDEIFGCNVDLHVF